MPESQVNLEPWLAEDRSFVSESAALSTLSEFSRIASDVTFGKNVRIFAFVNLYGCSIGDNSKIGTYRRDSEEC